MRRRVTAFSLIELTIVIAIIGILTALLIMGVNKMARSGRTKATGTDLENIQSFFDEMNAHAGMNTVPTEWVWRNSAAKPATASYPALPAGIAIPGSGSAASGSIFSISADFWKVPNPFPTVAPAAIPDALDAQGSIADTDGTGTSVLRNGSRAVLNTQLAMRILLSYGSNRAAISKLPADRLFIPNWVPGPLPKGAVTGKDGIYDTPADNGSDPVTSVTYAVNNCVRYQGATYRCIQATDTNSPPAYASPPTSNQWWVPDSNPTPLLLDAWGNPIIFVPASGLINVHGNDGTSDATIAVLNGTSTATLVPQPTFPYARAQPPIQSPDNRAYFVSAGPDGDLRTGDDNIYSFSK